MYAGLTFRILNPFSVLSKLSMIMMVVMMVKADQPVLTKGNRVAQVTSGNVHRHFWCVHLAV